ncbi:hypothetical protein CKO25_19820 [Thiocapsa imhoffii]|uniref:Nucleotidyltransferase family protein n=1 Tax=Thiocapsa imhoffii TaxID=382777 RepID=A0A9X0WLZ1_9GAMM|nr:nucleotidyltransferase family protein [Thiocapsa imhoffii]MBK1646840.1 hypothetical protein [Thiocapsa imhoffii]
MIEKNRLSPEGQFYCLVLAAAGVADAEVVREYDTLGDETIWAFAEREGATSIIGEKLRSVLGVEQTPQRWLEAVESTERRIGMYMEQLDRAAEALAKEGIPLVALKNSGIARGLHTALASTPMGDVDVLVAPNDFRRAHGILVGLGFELDDRSPFAISDIEDAEAHGGAEYRVALGDGTELWFELQWRPVAGRWIRPDQEPRADDLLARSVPMPGTAARLLEPEDNLLQVCLHTAKHSYVRAPGFRLHTDVDRIVHYCEIDWDSFCDRVERTGLRTAVYLSLVIPKRLLGSEIPDAVLERLDFAPWKHRLLLRWIQRVGLFGPKERKWSKLGYIVFNLFLYDSLAGVWRAVFPEAEWMQRQYKYHSPWMLPMVHIRRLFSLMFQRAKT